MKTKKLPTLLPEHKEALREICNRKDFIALETFLKVQQNNIVMFNWFRVKPNDPEIALKKARYDGQYEIIKNLLDEFNKLKKE